MGESFESVLTAAKLGQDWAWAYLYREIAGPVTGFLRARGVSEPEDVAGDVFFELARSLDRFEGDESAFRTFIFVITYHQLVAHRETLRHRRPRSALADEILDHLRDESGAAGLTPESPTIEELQRAFEVLTPEQRDVLSLRIIAGLSLEETARVVNRGVGAVRKLQRRGMLKVRGRLSGQAVAI